ncbi:hypothetical protein [Vibrio sp. ER1A]|uniref:hypothetical protein n=1 Tax=Vibrio sp. ER1A TaxID=1517681 RepID=UPI0004DCFBDE|nr:hypothetical protein [Vibrio sp. ER1A]KFA99264.1 hypothetical protein HW45_04795 [Vibrio sp. ER1A]
MAIQRKLKHISGLDDVEKLLDGLTDPKFRANALRNAARKSMNPVKDTLQSKLPAGGAEEESYKHYESYTGKKGYKPGDLRKGVKLKISVNSAKEIKTNRKGYVKDNQRSELFSTVTFDNHVYKLASILEHGRTRRVATTKNGKVFHYFGHATDSVKRDIGTTAPRNFISSTFAEHEGQIAETFKSELIKSISRQAKRLAKKNAGK